MKTELYIKKTKTALFFLLFSTVTLSQQLNITDPIRFLSLGDSYTICQNVSINERWPLQLRDSLLTRGILTDTVNIIATTGWRTDNLLNAIKNKGLQNQQYNFVSLLIGVNNQYQGRPFSQYRNEFPKLLDSAIRYAGGNPSLVFIVSIPDYAFTPYGQSTANPGQISLEIDKYNQFNKHIADSLSITYFDITPISRQGLQNPSYVASDGLHPSGIQYTEWVKLMLEHIDSITKVTVINSIQTYNTSIVKIAPNPSIDFITINIPETTVKQSSLVQIYDITGMVMLEQTISEKSFVLSIAELPIGLYFMKITSDQKQITKKIIKKAG